MESHDLLAALRKLFESENGRVVFWNDPDQEFAESAASLEIANVETIGLDEVGGLAVKLRLERADPNQKFLIYSGREQPPFDQDWLLDARLYGKSFHADQASIILGELGLTSQQVREHIQSRRAFFASKERLRKLKAVVAASDLEADLDRKMIAVVVRAERDDWLSIARAVLCDISEHLDGEDAELFHAPACGEQLAKLDLDQPFWLGMEQTFGYREECPSFAKLALQVFATEFASQLGEVPAALASLVLPRGGWTSAIICLSQWRDSTGKASDYDRLAGEVEERLRITELLSSFDLERLLRVTTFPVVEKHIMRGLRDRVETTAEVLRADDVRSVVSQRQAGHWANPAVPGSSAMKRRTTFQVYGAILAAAEFFELKNRFPDGFAFASPKALYLAYESELYRFDQLYRHFIEAADAAESEGWDVLKSLRQAIEASYTNWYMPNLGLAWGKFMTSQPGGLLESWQLEGVPNQFRFFDEVVARTLRNEDYRRVFVIISDAFRFEAAAELRQELNTRYRFQASLTSQLGVLPSYTALGMASLLPQRSLSYSECGEVLIEGRPTASLEQRGAILESVKGIAMKAEDLQALKREAGREIVKAREVIYLYHDKIDATGDKQPTEHDTFQAVRRAIDEIASLVSHIINNLNGSFVVVTADHGFLYTDSAPDETGKSAHGEKPRGTILAKRRYLIGRGLPKPDHAWSGRTSVTAGATGDMEFWVPRGSNRFHFTGGSRYGHGGAMLQEIVVPVLTVRHARGKNADETRTKSVAVHVLGSRHKVTTARHRFELIQTEAASDRIRPVTLRVAIYDGAEPITNIETVTFDSKSESMDDRRKWVTLTLKDRQYDRRAAYRLILRDSETGMDTETIDVSIDRAIYDDF